MLASMWKINAWEWKTGVKFDRTSCIWCLEARGSCQQTAVTLSGVIYGGLMKGPETKRSGQQALPRERTQKLGAIRLLPLHRERVAHRKAMPRVKVHFPHCPPVTGKVQRPPVEGWPCCSASRGPTKALAGIWGCAAWYSYGLKLPTCPKMCAKHSRDSNITSALKWKVLVSLCH